MKCLKTCCFCVGILLFCSAKLSFSVEPANTPDLELVLGELPKNHVMNRFQTFLFYDAAITGRHTALQRDEVEAAFIAKFGHSRWTLPVVIADVSKDSANYQLSFQGIDPAINNLEMKWEIAPVSLPMPKEEALSLQVGQIVYLSGDLVINQGTASREQPTNVQTIALTATNTRPNPKARSHTIFLKDIKLTKE